MKYPSHFKSAMKKLEIQELRKHQINPIKDVLNGHDSIIVLPTGAGKSAVFQIPALLSEILTVVIEPTMALMFD